MVDNPHLADLEQSKKRLGEIAGLNQRKASNPKVSAWVAASAGTGKTKVLTDRYLRLLLAGVLPQRILCLTFTKAAAAEMATRIAEKLAKWAIMPEAELIAEIIKIEGEFPSEKPQAEALLKRARQLFAILLDAPGGAKIQTIHSFCQQLLKRFPLEAGITPHFEVIDERTANEILYQARLKVISDAEIGSKLEEALHYISLNLADIKFDEFVARITYNRQKTHQVIEDNKGIEAVLAQAKIYLELGADESLESSISELCDISQEQEKTLYEFCKIWAEGGKNNLKQADNLGAWLVLNPQDRAANIELYLRAFLTKSNTILSKLANKNIDDTYPAIVEAMQREAEKAFIFTQKLKALEVIKATSAYLYLSEAINQEYETAKLEKSLLDYDDLIIKTRYLLEKTDSAAWVLYKLDGGLDHLLIDEAQDTSPSQWAVVRALAAEFFAGLGANEANRTVFAVGDRKQSIYGFQGADPAEFEGSRKYFAAAVKSIGQEFSEVGLEVSFRSVKTVLDAVNKVFNSPSAREGVLLSEEEKMEHLSYRAGEGGRVEILAPSRSQKNDEQEPWKPPVDRHKIDNPRSRIAQDLAKKIASLIKNKEILAAKGRPIEAGDIMILVKQRGGFVDDLVKALKVLDVPVAGVDRMMLSDQIAIMDLCSLMRFLLLPQDDLSLAEVLKSPLFGISEEELFKLAYNRGGKSLWERLLVHSGEETRLGEAQKFLLHLLSIADFLRPHELFAEVLSKFRGRKKIMTRLGQEAEDALNEFMNLALKYEVEHTPSLQGFLSWLTREEVEIKRDLEASARQSVRIMTAHGSKGLQAPIVFLPDTMSKPSVGKHEQVFWAEDNQLIFWVPKSDLMPDKITKLKEIEQQKADYEYRRLLYVAMTRAEDRLYIGGWLRKGQKEISVGTWYQMITDALKPAGAELPDADDNQPIICYEGAQEVTPQVTTVKPRELLDYAAPDWLEAAPEPEPTPPRPLAPSKTDEDLTAAASPLNEEGVNRFKRGRIIHEMLQILPELDPAKRHAAATRYVEKSCAEMSEFMRQNIVQETVSLLENPDFCEVFGTNSRAEVPVSGLIGKHVISGQIDRIAVLEDKVLIIDFKTNRPPPNEVSGVAETYLRQLAAYRAALRQIYPDKTIECALLWTHAPRLMLIPSAKLDAVSNFLEG